jgi:4-amino-4-deoxy-L-arabinose transferase-like glycosyltransferase
MAFESSRNRKFYLASLCIILAIGAFLRMPVSAFLDGNAPLRSLAMLHPNSKRTTMGQLGMDEGLYRRYVYEVIGTGLASYPTIVQHYLEVQRPLTGSILPPMRFLYIFAAYLWHVLFGSEPLAALNNVASLFSVLTLLLSTAFAWRMKGPSCALGLAALVGFAPLQIHMSQHAFVDGFFAFWALLSLWALWENLRAPRNWFWLITYVAALCFLVLTKENAFFVLVGISAVIALNRWLQIGTVTREVLLATFLGPFLGIAILAILVGGIEVLFTAYQLSVSKNYELPYAIVTGDGPWHRYLIDLLVVSPIVLILALGTIFGLDRSRKPELFLFVFIAASYFLMCNIKYGMNLRYAIIWDMPLRVLAFSQIVALCARFQRYRTVIICSAIGLVCLLELRQYIILAVEFPLYELIPQALLRALHILKAAPVP